MSDMKALGKAWSAKYAHVADTLKNLGRLGTVATAFNANIDAVVKIKGHKLAALAKKEGLGLAGLRNIVDPRLNTGADVVKAVFRCFEKGIAEEWISEEIDVYDWLAEHIGHDRLQMGGQAGIIANTLAVAGAPKVYVHCNSLPKMQANVFAHAKNLLSFDENGNEKPAYLVDRDTDIPLIHWIIEFDKGDTVEIDGRKITCPKSNRFIATYDPLNLRLVMDRHFVDKMAKNKPDVLILSGFHALTCHACGEGLIESAVPVIQSWKKPGSILHLELASTRDLKIRKAIVDKISPLAESLGINERELIDALEVIGEKGMAAAVEENPNSIYLFQGLAKMKSKLECRRIQLHAFGLYMILQDKDFPISPENALKGMALAATAAASKAGTGDLHARKSFLWAHGRGVSDKGLDEISNMAEYLENPELAEKGYMEYKDQWLVVLPTIIIDKPLTLVGMGDTISALSLVGSL